MAAITLHNPTANSRACDKAALKMEVDAHEEMLDPRGPAIVIHGTLQSGFKEAYGPFESVDAACKWAVPRAPPMGTVTVYILKPPAECTIQVAEET